MVYCRGDGVACGTRHCRAAGTSREGTGRDLEEDGSAFDRLETATCLECLWLLRLYGRLLPVGRVGVGNHGDGGVGGVGVIEPQVRFATSVPWTLGQHVFP